jgi:hypothetical protein
MTKRCSRAGLPSSKARRSPSRGLGTPGSGRQPLVELCLSLIGGRHMVQQYVTLRQQLVAAATQAARPFPSDHLPSVLVTSVYTGLRSELRSVL